MTGFCFRSYPVGTIGCRVEETTAHVVKMQSNLHPWHICWRCYSYNSVDIVNTIASAFSPVFSSRLYNPCLEPLKTAEALSLNCSSRVTEGYYNAAFSLLASTACIHRAHSTSLASSGCAVRGSSVPSCLEKSCFSDYENRR